MKALAAISPGCILLVACAGGSETGNPFGDVVPAQVALEVRASTTAYAIGSGSADTVITEAWVALGGHDGSFSFPGEGECGADFFDGTYPAGWWSPLAVVDLADPDARVEVDVPPGPRCGLVVPLMKNTPADALPPGAPAELTSHSVVVRGEHAGQRFVLLHDEDDELEIGAVDGTYEVTEDVPLLLSFEIERWMRGIDLDAATVGTDSVITISRSMNAADLALFEMQAECSLDLFADTNADGMLDVSTDELLARSSDPEDPCAAGN